MDSEQRNVPHGFCRCGCGKLTRLAPNSRTDRGWVKGEPLAYIFGHAGGRRKEPVRWVAEDRGYTTPCWIWQLEVRSDGYGRVSCPQARSYPAHRFYWEETNGPVPDGLVIDHLCRVRSCVNPDHMEPVTRAENVRRGIRTKLDPDKVREIRLLLAMSCSEYAIARRFGVARATVASISRGDTWKDVV